MNNEKTFDQMTWEELLLVREKLLADQEEIEATLNVLKTEFLEKLQKDGTPDGTVVGDKTISVRTMYTTDKDTAKELGAVKVITQERIDTGMIKALVLKGISVKNLQINKTPIVGDVVKKKKETEDS